MKKMKNEAKYWDNILKTETIDEFEKDLKKAKTFTAVRPPKVNITLRIEPLDLMLIKRKARQLGLPHSQLIASIVHQELRKQ